MKYERGKENANQKKVNKESPNYGAMIIEMIQNKATETQKERLYHFIKNYLG